MKGGSVLWDIEVLLLLLLLRKRNCLLDLRLVVYEHAVIQLQRVSHHGLLLLLVGILLLQLLAHLMSLLHKLIIGVIVVVVVRHVHRRDQLVVMKGRVLGRLVVLNFELSYSLGLLLHKLRHKQFLALLWLEIVGLRRVTHRSLLIKCLALELTHSSLYTLL